MDVGTVLLALAGLTGLVCAYLLGRLQRHNALVREYDRGHAAGWKGCQRAMQHPTAQQLEWWRQGHTFHRGTVYGQPRDPDATGLINPVR